jgi:carbon-monoxide dehydrogenase iron sulfur subunit
MKGIIYIDVDKCLGCKACEIECAIEHSKSKNLFGAISEKPLPQYRVKIEGLDEFNIPLQCRHCEDAPCIEICPTSALKKLGVEQPVILERELCIGCKWCVLVCPFGVIKLDREGKLITKCDLCYERLKLNEKPACVEGCPTKALKFMTMDEIIKEKKDKFLIGFKKSKKVSAEITY